jgi:hypothetical protein
MQELLAEKLLAEKRWGTCRDGPALKHLRGCVCLRVR